ncbi:MAG: hypothetical protein NVSMB10_10300 [Steroidobacteraceae bacterium]
MHAEQQQEHITDGDGRKHQGQMDDCIQKTSARETLSTESPREHDGERQAADDAARGDRHTKAERCGLAGGQPHEVRRELYEDAGLHS